MKFGFIGKLGGYTEAFNALKEAGYDIKEEQSIRVWETRKRVPPEAQLKLMAWGAKCRQYLTAEDFKYKKLPTVKKKDEK